MTFAADLDAALRAGHLDGPPSCDCGARPCACGLERLANDNRRAEEARQARTTAQGGYTRRGIGDGREGRSNAPILRRR